uniref:TIL domain-containing protein n=1 Tax=Caenorhabditis tropicalis TaxID=1561998 RepID=A0A1I7UGY0_9PELO
MFKVLAVSAILMVLACEAANLACKSEVNVAVAGICPTGSVLVNNGCCDKQSVYNIDDQECRSESVGPAFGGYCPDGYVVVAGEECCPASDAVAKQK